MIRLFSMVSLAGLVAGCAPQAGSFATPIAPAVQKPADAPALNYPLLYIADLGTNEVYVDSYPQGKLQFTLSGFGSANGVCADFNGNVFVSDAHDSELIEFQYGSTKQLGVLKDPGYYLGGCSIDPSTGDLAVAIQPANSDPGGVAVFRHAKGKAKNYTAMSTYFARSCTYDLNKNLYLDGTNVNGGFFLAEMPAKAKTLDQIVTYATIVAAGGLHWDGYKQLLLIDDQGVGYQGSTVYEFRIDGSAASEEGSTPLGDSTDVPDFTLVPSTGAASRLIGANTGQTPSVMYWHYPKGGSPTKTLTGFSEPVSVVIASEPSLRRR